MSRPAEEYFGSGPQLEMQRAGEALWPLLRDDPRYSYEGRCVGFDAPNVATVPMMEALARTQGGTASFFVDAAKEATVTAALERDGFTTDRWDHLMAGESGVALSRRVVGGFALPSGLTLHELDADTPEQDLATWAVMAQSCGVLLPAGKALRGINRHAVFFVIANEAGEPVACSGAVARHHRDSPFADASWWGMLATREDMRGRGLSLYLGALAMATMADRHGYRRFYTGVRTDNAASQHLCRKLGLTDHGLAVMVALDPRRFGDTKLTR